MREEWRGFVAAALVCSSVAVGACGRIPLLSADDPVAPPGDASPGIPEARPEIPDATVEVSEVRSEVVDAGVDVPEDMPRGADASVEVPPCPVLLAPVLSIIDDDEVLKFASRRGGTIELAALPAAAPLSTAAFHEATEVTLKGLAGPTRVLGRGKAPTCVPVFFDAVYDVRAVYAPAPPDGETTAIAFDDPRIVAWAQGAEDYAPGDGVSAARWMMPTHALGPVGTDNLAVVVLGNGGRITLTFGKPIADGPGWDFAVFENTFANDLFLELAFVEVSSDGSRFARFDSAFRGPLMPCASCSGKATGIGGLAGAYRFGFGTPFDLAALRSAPLVREGGVDLSSIRYVRIVDVFGDGTTLDSFGRGIVDPLLGGGTSGFDLDAVGVLNQRP